MLFAQHERKPSAAAQLRCAVKGRTKRPPCASVMWARSLRRAQKSTEVPAPRSRCAPHAALLRPSCSPVSPRPTSFLTAAAQMKDAAGRWSTLNSPVYGTWASRMHAKPWRAPALRRQRRAAGCSPQKSLWVSICVGQTRRAGRSIECSLILFSKVWHCIVRRQVCCMLHAEVSANLERELPGFVVMSPCTRRADFGYQHLTTATDGPMSHLRNQVVLE